MHNSDQKSKTRDVREIICSIANAHDSIKGAVHEITLSDFISKEDGEIVKILEDLRSNLQVIEDDYIKTVASSIDNEPINEWEALDMIMGMISSIRDQYHVSIEEWLYAFKNKPRMALRDENNMRKLARLEFYNDFLDKMSLVDMNLRFEDLIFRFRSALKWCVEKECASVVDYAPISQFEYLYLRYRRQASFELLYFYNITPKKDNALIDIFFEILKLKNRIRGV